MIECFDLTRKEGWGHLHWMMQGRKPRAKFSLLRTWHKEYIKRTAGGIVHYLLYPITRGVKPFWELPVAPVCKECDKAAFPAVYNTGDGWAWGWECDRCGPDEFWWGDLGEDNDQEWDWPFLRNWAGTDDWERLGIVVC
jgi:hypothetical protein